MNPLFAQGERERVLMLAPHPDDEVLAAGGLLQRAAAAGAAVQVLFATDGESNPWPQRAAYRKWRLTPDDRMRWGHTRRQEACRALEELGLPASCARFLGLPDQGITACLMRRPVEIQTQLAEALRAWQPTLVLLPSPADRHRDHNALALGGQIALRTAGLGSCPALQYIVHGQSSGWGPGALLLPLSAAEQERKRRGILCHRTQMLLSRRRFLSYVRPEEEFRWLGAPLAAARCHPVRGGALEDGTLRVELRLPWRQRALRHLSLLAALETEQGESLRWSLPLSWNTGAVSVRDTVAHRPLGSAAIEAGGSGLKIRIFLRGIAVASAAVKVHAYLGFHDLGGWRSLPELEAEPAAEVGFSEPLGEYAAASQA